MLYVSSSPAPIELSWSSVRAGVARRALALSFSSAASPAREASLLRRLRRWRAANAEHEVHMHKMRELWIAAARWRFAGWSLRGLRRRSRANRSSDTAALLLIGASAFAIPALVAG